LGVENCKKIKKKFVIEKIVVFLQPIWMAKEVIVMLFPSWYSDD
jgi:hypothetical protein